MIFFKRLLLFTLILASTFVGSQEQPPIKNYTTKIYGAENQNWAISQSSEKYIYIANNSGLLEFNGSKWNLYPSSNNSITRSVNVIDDKIYTGCYREFGYWTKNEFGKLNYNSLSDKIKDLILEDEQFWNILKFDDWILFQSLNRIYIYNTIEGTFNIIDSKTQLPKIFKVDSSLYFQKMEEGVFRIENGKEVLISDHPILKENILVSIFEDNGKILLLTQENGFYSLDGDKLTKWNINANKILSSISVYSCMQLDDGSFILGTISNGIYQLDKQGDIISQIDQEKGLNNNTILSLFEDVDHNLWLGLDNGISVVNLKSPFKFYNDINGEIGAVYASAVFKNYLYLGTNQGLYYKNLGVDEAFEFIKGTEGQVWCLKELDNTLFCGHNSGTFVVNDNSVELISDVMGTWDIKPVKDKNNMFLQGHYTGFNIIEKINNKWQYKNELEGFHISSRFFEFTKDNKLLVNHEYKGVFKLVINEDYTKVLEFSKENSAPKGLKSSLVNYDDEVLYISDKGIFKYDRKKEIFNKDSVLTHKFLDGEIYVSGKFTLEKENNNLWGFTEDNIINFSPGKLNDILKVNKIYLPSLSRKDIPGFENISPLSKQKYLLGSTNGYTIMDLNNIYEEKFTININSVKSNTLNSPDAEVSLTKKKNFNARENNIHFEYSVPVFNENKVVEYSYILEGIYNEWSDWSSTPSVSFKNLPFGDYTFRVNAKIGNKLSDGMASYSFTIDRPWYLSNRMIFVYFLLLIFIFYIVHLIYRSYYSKQKQKLLDKKQREFAVTQLENEKVIMKLRNDKLRQEVESKTRELSASTLNIIKKNELLNKIKKELLSINGDKQLKSVIKIINKNLSTNSDWEMFQEAFNNADSGFLKRIKLLHPKLTPNDLRLCAYLRLNLSSKEIAPLLNISARSVEIKRYRLRKKMDLPHEKNLVEYILEV